MPDRNRFVRGSFAWLGFRQIAVPYAVCAPAATRNPPSAGPPTITTSRIADDVALAVFRTKTALASPQEGTLAQLRIECFHPADTLTEETAARLARSG